MKLFITIILVLAISIGLGVLALEDPGYVVLTRDPYVVRLPLLLFIGIIFLAFVLLYLFLNFLTSLFRAPKNYRQWRISANENSAQQHTMQGYAGLIEGNWNKAESSLLKKIEHNKIPLMNYLGAAYAAHQQNQPGRRNQYLDEALALHPNNDLAINLTRARLLYKSGELLECKDYLESLRVKSSKNIPVATLLADVYQGLENWDALIKLIPVMRKIKALPEEALNNREQFAYSQLISSPALSQDESGNPAMTWKSLPSAKKKEPAMIMGYVNQLISDDKLEEAETVLRTALRRQFDENLMKLYGSINSSSVESQIKFVQSLNKKYIDHPAFLWTLARLNRYIQDFNQSKEFYKKAIDAGADKEIYADFGTFLEQTGETEKALFFFKKSVAELLPQNNESSASLSREVLEASQQSTDKVPVVR